MFAPIRRNNGTKKILIVDDDRDLCEVLAGHVVNIFDDIQVACCYDGGKALQEINFGGFDCMVFDLQLPLVDGIELIRRTISKPENEQAEIYVVSGNIDENAQRSLDEMNIRGYIHKPFTFQDIYDMMRK